MAPAAKSRTLVVGIGHPHRGDDAAGLLVARELMHHRCSDVRVLQTSGGTVSLMDSWQEAERVFLVDAVQSASSAGTIHRVECGQGPLPFEASGPGTHGFGVAGVIELARTLNRLPGQLVVYGIEGAAFSIGDALSPPVEEAVPEVVKRILAEVESARLISCEKRSDGRRREGLKSSHPDGGRGNRRC